MGAAGIYSLAMTYRLAATITLLSASLTLAQPSSDIEKALAEFQRSWISQDKGAASKLISDDLVWFSIRGRMLEKQEVLNTLSQRGGMEKLQDKKVRVYGDTTVITSDGEPGSLARRTLVWRKS
jgi:hypothetical protein